MQTTAAVNISRKPRSRPSVPPRPPRAAMACATRPILVAFRHGLRVSELVALRWNQVDLAHGLLHVNRAKNGMPSVHPLRGPELRALRRVRRDYPETPYVFVVPVHLPQNPRYCIEISCFFGF